jgi:hypothetical protein
VASKATAQSLDGKAARFKGSGKKQTLHQAKHLSYMQAVLLLDLCPKGGSNEALISNPSPTTKKKKKKKKLAKRKLEGRNVHLWWAGGGAQWQNTTKDRIRAGEGRTCLFLNIFKIFN